MTKPKFTGLGVERLIGDGINTNYPTHCVRYFIIVFFSQSEPAPSKLQRFDLLGDE